MLDDEEILAALDEVELGHLPDQFGGLDTELNWAGVHVRRRTAAAGVCPPSAARARASLSWTRLPVLSILPQRRTSTGVLSGCH